jgi:hypothetical protein
MPQFFLAAGSGCQGRILAKLVIGWPFFASDFANNLQFDSWPQIAVVDPKKALDKKRAPEIA